jgi:alpha-L-fucosidase
MTDLTWFDAARYGLFIHWGPYSVAGRGEWVANRERIPLEEYRTRYVDRFTAEHYDPAAWADFAARCGMKYVVLTTRHHDGFCLWDTKTTDFNSTRLGPKRDLVAPFVEAVRARGLKVGFYFSVADWYHRDYPNAYARDWPTKWHDEQARQRFHAYYAQQVQELMSRFGRIDLLWYDGCIPQPLDGKAVNEAAKQAQPHLLINDRLGEPFDFNCSEQAIKPRSGAWEACLTLNENWGFHAGDHEWKTPKQVVRLLLSCASQGGNLLINVGPRGDGTIPEPSVRILERVGEWLARNGEFLPRSGRSPFSWNNEAMFTVRDDVLYVHLLAPAGDTFCLADLANEVRSARHVATGEEVPFDRAADGRIHLRGLPPLPPDGIATTIALHLDGPPRARSPKETFWIPG